MYYIHISGLCSDVCSFCPPHKAKMVEMKSCCTAEAELKDAVLRSVRTENHLFVASAALNDVFTKFSFYGPNDLNSAAVKRTNKAAGEAAQQ